MIRVDGTLVMLANLVILTVLGLLVSAVIVYGCLIVFRIVSLAKANFVCRAVVVIDAHHN